MPVDTPHKEYEAAFPKWERARDCYEGSDAVKDQGVKYLPQLDSHKRMVSGGTDQYNDYLMRAMQRPARARDVVAFVSSEARSSATLTSSSAVSLALIRYPLFRERRAGRAGCHPGN